MDGAIQFNGLVGIVILFGTMISLAVIILIVAAVYFLKRSHGSGIKKYLFYPAIMLLIFDVFVFLSIALGPDKVWTKDEAVAFDERMFYIWLPAHIGAFVFLAVIFYFVSKRRAEIDSFVERLR